MRGATRGAKAYPAMHPIFQSTPPVRGATKMFFPAPCGASGYFNPRPPCGGRPGEFLADDSEDKFQSTPPVRGATHWGRLAMLQQEISIHAPPCGGRPVPSMGQYAFMVFQSTPPVRGATEIQIALLVSGEISIHAPRAGGDC